MDIVYASLHRKESAAPAPPRETAEILGALWAHAVPEDGLEHASCRAEPDRVDLLLYLLTLTLPDPQHPSSPAPRDAFHRAEDLLARCHRASPLLNLRFLPPRRAA